MDKLQPVQFCSESWLCLPHIKPVWHPGVWLHFNTEAPCEYLALNTIGAEGKTKQKKNKGKRWSHLLFPCLTTETILLRRKHHRGPTTICQLRVVSRERAGEVSQSDSKSRRAGTKEKTRIEKGLVREVGWQRREGEDIYMQGLTLAH